MIMGPDMDKNRLGGETSPYLLQHRDNPVHWRAWSAETLAAAKAADKPILRRSAMPRATGAM